MSKNPKNLQFINQIKELDQTHVWHPYQRLPAPYPLPVVERAWGVYIETSQGRLIDGMSSWWACIHGYNHPAIVNAMNRQMQKMCHVMFGGLTHAPAVLLTKALIEMTPMHACFLVDSGSVAVEVAQKMAMQATGKSAFGTCLGGYHGDTWHAMSVCDPQGGMHHLYRGRLSAQYFLPRPPKWQGHGDPDPLVSSEILHTIETFFDTHAQNMAGFIIEPIVQGAGGMHFYPPAYLRALRDACTRHQIPLILDEIATGFGRTGYMFGYEWASITPDILTLGKALTGGHISLAAALCTRKIAHAIDASKAGALMHGPTFMGNPLACAAALAALNLTKDAPAKAAMLGGQMRALAQGIPHPLRIHIKEVRILGAIFVIELRAPIDADRFCALCPKYGIWVRPFGHLVYLMPPICIDKDALRDLFDGLFLTLVAYFK